MSKDAEDNTTSSVSGFNRIVTMSYSELSSCTLHYCADHEKMPFSLWVSVWRELQGREEKATNAQNRSPHTYEPRGEIILIS